jgi:serine/threonine protein kinase
VPPEQVTGDSAGPRGDVYSAGVMLFEMITGRQPFTGDTPLSVAYQHVNRTFPRLPRWCPASRPPSTSSWSRPPAGIPARRPADAGEFLRAVRRVRETCTSRAGSPA